jgi:NAD(P)H-hydrate epimerase
MLVTVKQIQALDKIAIERIGIPSAVLMENAGRAVAQEVLRYLTKKRRPSVCVFCGLGNNAGDGFVAARHLLVRGIRVQTFLLGDPKNLKGDAALNYRIFRKLGGPFKKIGRMTPAAARAMAGCAVVVDALFGVGLNREIQDPFRGIIEKINAAGRAVIAVDVPSGLNATTGEVFGVCVKATRTVTFTCPKKGFFRREGPRHTGKIIVADIGIPKQLVQRIK